MKILVSLRCVCGVEVIVPDDKLDELSKAVDNGEVATIEDFEQLTGVSIDTDEVMDEIEIEDFDILD